MGEKVGQLTSFILYLLNSPYTIFPLHWPPTAQSIEINEPSIKETLGHQPMSILEVLIEMSTLILS